MSLLYGPLSFLFSPLVLVSWFPVFLNLHLFLIPSAVGTDLEEEEKTAVSANEPGMLWSLFS